jgi:hypothetical protein
MWCRVGYDASHMNINGTSSSYFDLRQEYCGVLKGGWYFSQIAIGHRLGLGLSRLKSIPRRHWRSMLEHYRRKQKGGQLLRAGQMDVVCSIQNVQSLLLPFPSQSGRSFSSSSSSTSAPPAYCTGDSGYMAHVVGTKCLVLLCDNSHRASFVG